MKHKSKSKTVKNKIWKYHKSHTFKDNRGEIFSFVTQLYQVGVYGILNGDSSMQGNFKPSQIVSIEKALLRDSKSGKITELTFGTPIRVTVENGLYKEVTDI